MHITTSVSIKQQLSRFNETRSMTEIMKESIKNIRLCLIVIQGKAMRCICYIMHYRSLLHHALF